jgi:glucose/arabinose dehydrogenase
VALAAPGLPADLGGGVSVKAAPADDARDAPDSVVIDVIDRGGNGWNDLQAYAAAVAKRLTAANAMKKPASFPTDEKQVFVLLDREKCNELGVAPRDVYKTIQERGASLKADNLKTVKVGKIKISLSQVVEVKEVICPAAVYRVNRHPAVRITGLAPDGTASREATVKCVTLAEEEISRLGRKGFAAASLSTSGGPNQTKIVRVTPRNKAKGIDPRAPVQIHFSNGLRLSTLGADSVRLLTSAGAVVPAKLGTDIEGDVVNIQPKQRLQPGASYVVEVTSKLLDKEGQAVAPFRSTFVAGADAAKAPPRPGFIYTKTNIDTEHGPTAIAIGPDGNVYVATYRGLLYRLRIDPKTGLALGKDKLLTLEGRKILGLTFDPQATERDLRAWITYDDRDADKLDVGTFSGVVSQVAIPDASRGGAAKETPYIVGLPSGWHPLNGGTFGPDKRLYVSVGSMNRLGDDRIRPETLLSAAVVVADVRGPKFNGGRLPLNVQTTAPVNYDPYAINAPLKLYATGFRQLYRLCWHSNGSLYGGVNQNDGTGRSDTPSAPGVPSLRSVFPDEDLVRIVEGGYYGHPNPSRKEYVLMGGNPTAGVDPWEVPEYPVGVRPDPNFNPANLIFNLKAINGTSANGCCEYTLPGPLQGRLLICFYEGTHTVHTFAFDAKGAAVTDQRPLVDEKGESLKSTQPLDIAVHASGQIYVADFGEWRSFGNGGAIWVLNARAK